MAQRCGKCGYEWNPRGRSYSIKCPGCGHKFSKEEIKITHHESSDDTVSGIIGTGALLAALISWIKGNSIWWIIFHFFCNWLYVIYAAVKWY